MRLIDADNLVEKIKKDAPSYFGDATGQIIKSFFIMMAKTESITPTIDAVKIVRCKDCKYREYDNCPFNEFSELYKPDDNFFCANGERK